MVSNVARDKLLTELRKSGISDERVLQAMVEVPRENFVPGSIQAHAYENVALPIGHGQTISQPLIVAMMTEVLQLMPVSQVLEVGTGSGYQTAVLAKLCQQVVTVERIEALAENAKKKLDELGITNVEFIVGDGSLGYELAAPYDAIIVTAGSNVVPQPLLEQLSVNGRLVIPVGDEAGQILQLHEKMLRGINVSSITACRFVKLIGEHGWPDGL